MSKLHTPVEESVGEQGSLKYDLSFILTTKNKDDYCDARDAFKEKYSVPAPVVDIYYPLTNQILDWVVEYYETLIYSLNVDCKYTVGVCIGKGSAAEVMSVREKIDGSEVVLKRVIIPYGKEERWGPLITCITEMNYMNILKHRYIASLEDVVFATSGPQLLIERGEVLTRKMRSDDDIKKIMKCLLEAVEYMHSKDIVHLDIKFENVVMNNIKHPQLIDFGFARRCPHNLQMDHNEKFVTHWYRPPELFERVPRSGKAVDIWSLGVMFVELYHPKHPPFASRLENETYINIRHTVGIGSPSRSVYRYIKPLPKNNGMEDLIYKMLRYNPVERITATEALAHPFFS